MQGFIQLDKPSLWVRVYATGLGTITEHLVWPVTGETTPLSC